MIEIWISNQEVWWNRGVEVKPSREAFRKFTFEKVNNFNISWIDELHINVIVPNGKKATLIKIIDNNDDDDITTKYYYLMEVLNKTSKNKECIYQLDIWLTFILNSDILGSTGLRTINSIKTLNPNEVPPTINFIPTGIPTGRIETIIKKQQYYNDGSLIFTKPSNINPTSQLRLVPGITTNIYYVFKSKEIDKPDWGTASFFSNGWEQDCDYVLVPVLNCSGMGLTKSYDTIEHVPRGATPPTPPSWKRVNNDVFEIRNDKNTLDSVVRKWSEFGNNGLGEFLGIWVGPNYFRFENNFSNTYKPNIENVCVFPFFPGHRPPGPTARAWRTNDIIVNYPSSFQYALLALRIKSNGINIKPMNNFEVDEMIRNYKFLEDDNNNILKNANRVYFNNCFSFSNGNSAIDIDIQLPSTNDMYYNILNQQKSTRNTSLALSGIRAIVSTGASLSGIIPTPPTESITTTEFNTKNTTGPQSINTFREKHVQGAITSKTISRDWGVDISGRRNILLESNFSYKRSPKEILNLQTNTQRGAVDRLSSGTRTTTRTGAKSVGVGGYVGGVLGIVDAGLQFASTLAQQEAYKNDLRVSTSKTYYNINTSYVNWMTISQQLPKISSEDINRWNTIDDVLSDLCKEVIYGATTNPGNLPNFYGYDITPNQIGGDVVGITNEAYILIDELTKLNLEVQLSNKYSPTIKAGIITLLTNGVRMTSNPNIFSYFDNYEETT